MINGEMFEAPVVKINVDTPYYSGALQALSIENPVYDLVVGNVPGTCEANNPNRNWTPTVETSVESKEERSETMSVESECVHTLADVKYAVVTRAQKVAKPMKPLKVVMSRDMKVDSEELKRLQRDDLTLSHI